MSNGQSQRATGRTMLDDPDRLLDEGQYFASFRGVSTAHVAEEGVAPCGYVFRADVDKSSKHERARITDPTEQEREQRRWKRWESYDDLPENYSVCGMCRNTIQGVYPEQETVDEIASDVREFIGTDRDSAAFTKAELKRLRAVLQKTAGGPA